jgi:hypothetical protein
VVVFRNIEERRAAEWERDALAEYLHQVFAATTDAVAALDRNWRFSFLNDNRVTIARSECGDARPALPAFGPSRSCGLRALSLRA